eukprot:scaffold2730_cov247-Pinguiococcus_pyrenoidosus.AAC.10
MEEPGWRSWIFPGPNQDGLMTRGFAEAEAEWHNAAGCPSVPHQSLLSRRLSLWRRIRSVFSICSSKQRQGATAPRIRSGNNGRRGILTDPCAAGDAPHRSDESQGACCGPEAPARSRSGGARARK